MRDAGERLTCQQKGLRPKESENVFGGMLKLLIQVFIIMPYAIALILVWGLMLLVAWWTRPRC